MLPGDYFIAINCRLSLGPGQQLMALNYLMTHQLTLFYRSQRKTTHTTNTFTSFGIWEHNSVLMHLACICCCRRHISCMHHGPKIWNDLLVILQCTCVLGVFNLNLWDTTYVYIVSINSQPSVKVRQLARPLDVCVCDTKKDHLHAVYNDSIIWGWGMYLHFCIGLIYLIDLI